MYERCFNWTGVLIESNPLNFKALRVSKRDARLVHSAVCTGDGSSASTVPIAVEGFAVSGEMAWHQVSSVGIVDAPKTRTSRTCRADRCSKSCAYPQYTPACSPARSSGCGLPDSTCSPLM